MRSIVLVILCSLWLHLCYGQNETQGSLKGGKQTTLLTQKQIRKRKVKPDSLFVRNYDNLLSLDIPFASTYLTVDLTDKLTQKVMNYHPHSDLTLGLEAGFQVIGLGYSVNSGLSSYSDKTYGKTDYTDYSFSFSTHRLICDLYYENFKGFYLYNYQSFPKTSPADTSKIFPQRPDMKANSAGLSFYYIQNFKHFSYKAAFSNSEEQLKSAGTFLWGGYISTFSLEADSGLVFGKYKRSLGGYASINRSVTMNIGVSPGYMYTFVFKHHFYATIAVNPGIAFMSYASIAHGPRDTIPTSRDSTFKVVSTSNLGFKIQSRISVGYNSPKWYAGLTFAGDAFYQDETISKSKVDYAIGSVRVFVGYRFRVPLLNKLWSGKDYPERIDLHSTSAAGL
jgi:hypothetical protein